MTKEKIIRAKKRAGRVRAKLSGTAERPRLVVRKSNYALTAQLVNDADGTTLISLRVKGKNITAGKTIGEMVVKAAKEKKVKAILFDRGPHKYHGVVAAVAQVAREGGLVF